MKFMQLQFRASTPSKFCLCFIPSWFQESTSRQRNLLWPTRVQDSRHFGQHRFQCSPSSFVKQRERECSDSSTIVLLLRYQTAAGSLRTCGPSLVLGRRRSVKLICVSVADLGHEITTSFQTLISLHHFGPRPSYIVRLKRGPTGSSNTAASLVLSLSTERSSTLPEPQHEMPPWMLKLHESASKRPRLQQCEGLTFLAHMPGWTHCTYRPRACHGTHQ